MATIKKVAVLVTTAKKGVFFGFTKDLPGLRKSLDANGSKSHTISEARCVVKWVGTKGFLGLAVEGPNSSCRIGPAAPEFTVNELTSAAVCSEKAVEAFEKAPWN